MLRYRGRLRRREVPIKYERLHVELRQVASWLYRNQPVAALASGVEGLERATLPAPRLLRNVMLALVGSGDVARARRVLSALPPELRGGAS